MNSKTLILIGLCCLIISCKSNFVGKKLSYETDSDYGFEMSFVNDSTLTVSSKNEVQNAQKEIYKYEFMDKVTLERMRKNQPPVNFKTDKLHGQFYQKIAIKSVNGQNRYLKQTDTLNYVKMRIDGKMTKRIYFDNGNKFIEL